MLKVLDKLFELKDEKYANFHSNLIPNIPREKIIGVRVPQMRKLAKEYFKSEEAKLFLSDSPHKYYDENLLHGMLISEIKDYDECINELEKFLPFIDNWAVCDTISPKAFKNNKEKLTKKIKIWISSKKTYVCRFGVLMLMKHFLGQNRVYRDKKEKSEQEVSKKQKRQVHRCFFYSKQAVIRPRGQNAYQRDRGLQEQTKNSI